MTGRIDRGHWDKGYLFIEAETGETIFAHIKDFDVQPEPFDRTLTGRRVSFSTRETPKGIQASNVRLT